MLYDSYDAAKAALLDFITKNKRQEDGKFDDSIGGSEMSKVCGYTKYGGIKSLIGSKLKISGYTFNGNMMTRWGNIMETMSRLVLEKSHNIVTISSPCLNGFCKYSRYSPDDFAIIYLDGVKKYAIILIEYKSPYCRIPNGKINDDYKYQCLSGLASIPIAHYCLFMDVSYRRCSSKQFGFIKGHTYDETHGRQLSYIPMGLCLLGIKSKSSKILDSITSLVDNDKKTDRMLIDFGSVDTELFTETMYDIYYKKLEVIYFDPLFPSDKLSPDTYINTCKKLLLYNDEVIGFIPFKIMLYKSTIMDRCSSSITSLIDKASPKIEKIMDIVSTLRKLDTDSLCVEFDKLDIII